MSDALKSLRWAANIPETMRERESWICWRTEDRDGDDTKVPVKPFDSGHPYAKTNDSATWGTFEQAAGFHMEPGTDTDGLGFVFHDDDLLMGVDLDDVRDPDTGDVEPWARDIIIQLDSYTEVSPSGTGYHVYVLATKPDGSTQDSQERTLDALADADAPKVEMYGTGRFFTVTGDVVSAISPMNGRPSTRAEASIEVSTGVEQRNDEIAAVHDEYVASDDPVAAAKAAASPAPSVETNLSDDLVYEKAVGAKNGEKFKALWGGDDSYHGGDTSRADLALCLSLAFWTQRDKHQMDALFRKSDRLRAKWDEVHAADGRTYGELTIDEACALQQDVYDPGGGEGGAGGSLAAADDDGRVASTYIQRVLCERLEAATAHLARDGVNDSVRVEARVTLASDDPGVVVTRGECDE